MQIVQVVANWGKNRDKLKPIPPDYYDANYGMDCRLKLAENNLPVRANCFLHFDRFYKLQFAKLQ
jgi:hypothetical protein